MSATKPKNLFQYNLSTILLVMALVGVSVGSWRIVRSQAEAARLACNEAEQEALKQQVIAEEQRKFALAAQDEAMKQRRIIEIQLEMSERMFEFAKREQQLAEDRRREFQVLLKQLENENQELRRQLRIAGGLPATSMEPTADAPVEAPPVESD